MCIVVKIQGKRKREYWVHPFYIERLLNHELRQYPSKFLNYCRMSVDSFDELLPLLKSHIFYKNTRWRLAVPPEEN
jgi:hypothetical protein